MLERFKRFFTPGAAVQQASVPLASTELLDEVPQFPPFPRGFPAVDPVAVLERQQDLLDDIRNMLGFNHEDHEAIVMPILHRYVAYVHLLPASQIHHHRGAGGLLRHGLEVAFWAGQASKAIVFPYDGAMRHKHEHRVRWRFAYFLAGLTHDVGKPVTDMQITDESGLHVWDPYGPSLVEWSSTHQIGRYYIRWVANRKHKQHESGGLLIANRILGQSTISYLSKLDNQLMPQLTRQMSGANDPGDQMMRVVMDADRHSVMRDMKANRLEINGYSHGIPVEQHVIEVLRKLTAQNTWKVNAPDATIWHLPEGVFIRWENAVKDINRMIMHLSIPGIPKDPHVLADILIERSIACSYETITEDAEVIPYRYHRLSVSDKAKSKDDENAVLALRFAHPDYVFDGVSPPLLRAGVILYDKFGNVASPAPSTLSLSSINITQPQIDLESDVSEEEHTTAHKTDDTKIEIPGQNTPSVQRVPLDLDSLVQAMVEREGPPPPLPDAPELETIGAKKDDVTAGDSNEKLSQSAETSTDDSSSEEIHTASKPAATVGASSANSKAVAGISGGTKVQRVAPLQGRPLQGTGNVDSDNAAQKPEGVTSTPKQDTARERLDVLLTELDEAGAILRTLVEPVLKGERMLGEELLRHKGDLVVTYPAGIERIGTPADVVARLSNADVLVGDKLFPKKKVHDVGGIRALRLTPRLSMAISEAIDEVVAADDPFGQDVASPATPPQPDISIKPVQPQVENAPTEHSTPLPELFVQNISDNDEDDRAWTVPQQQKPPHEKPGSSDQDLLSETRQKEQVTTSEEPSKGSVLAKPKMKRRSGSATAQSELNSEEPSRTAAIVHPSLLSGPPEITADEILTMLKEMMLEGAGRWLVEPVEREGNYLTVPEASVIKSIVLDYPSRISMTKMRLALSTSGQGFSIKQKKIRLYIGDQVP